MVFATGIICAALFSAEAQLTARSSGAMNKTTFGVHGGVNFFTITGKTVIGADIDNDITTGFSAGVNAEVPVGRAFYLQPGVEYVRKGTENEAGDVKTSLSYIDIPVNLVYKPVLGTGKLLIGAGPYIGFGIGGKRTFSNANVSAEQDVEFVDDYTNGFTPQFRRIDAGANFLTGYEFANHLSVLLKAQLGLKNIQPNSSGGNGEAKWNNTGFGVSLGYRF